MGGILELVLLLPVLLVSMMAHEVSHGYVAYRLGDPTAKAHGRLTANPLKHLDPLGSMMFVITYMVGGFIFGWAKPVPIPPLDGSRIIGGLLSPSAYRWWADLDRYGMLFILFIFIVLQGPFFTLLRYAFALVSSILLSAYF